LRFLRFRLARYFEGFNIQMIQVSGILGFNGRSFEVSKNKYLRVLKFQVLNVSMFNVSFLSFEGRFRGERFRAFRVLRFLESFEASGNQSF
jgi:hypothetical protein